jgi:hypothetical protein
MTKLVVPLRQFMYSFLWFTLRRCRYVGHVASNGRMTWNNLKGISVHLVQVLCWHLLRGTLKFLCQDNPCLDADLNRPLPVHKSRTLPVHQHTRFFRGIRIEHIHFHSIVF